MSASFPLSSAALPALDVTGTLPASRRETYMPYLDGLRGVAISLVILLHAGVPFAPGGWLGVDIFFVLSGFLITSLLIREHEKTGGISLRRFYARRALRLLPALLVMLGVFLLIYAGSPNFRQAVRSAAYVVFYVANWIRAKHIFISTALGHTWSLSVEEQFYLLWPLMFIAMARLRLSRRSMAVIALLIAVACGGWRWYLQSRGATPPRLYYGLDTRFDALLLGCALALAEPLIRPGRWLTVMAFIAAAFLAFMVFRVTMILPWVLAGGYSLVALAAAVLILHLRLGSGGMARQMLTLRPLVGLGKISYGVYLWHLPVMTWLDPTEPAVGASHWVLRLLVGGGIAIVVAWVSFVWIEQPFLRLKSRYAAPAPSPALASAT